MLFRFLGPVVVCSEDGASLNVGGPKQRTVLAVLCLAPGAPVSVDRLLEAVWGEPLPDRARQVLQTYVSNLRKELGDVIRFEADAYTLSIDRSAVDWCGFVDAVDSASQLPVMQAGEVCREALEAWRGDVPFTGIEGHGAFEDTIALLRSMRLQAELAVGEADLVAGHAASAVERIEPLLKDEEFDELLRSLHMRALYAAGRQRDALASCAAYRRGLADVGLEPSRELDELELRILNHDEVLAASAAKVVLPAFRTSFVGRGDELEAGHHFLRDSRIVTLVGPPGSGKTRLAVELASQERTRFEGGVTFIPLASVTDERLAGSAVATALGLDEVPGETPVEQMSSLLAERHALLVLDNYEQILGAAALVGELVDASPGVSILVTSRSPLGISGEQVVPVRPLDVPVIGQELTAEDAARYDAVSLFVERACASNPAFSLQAGGASAVGEIAARLDGLPLAIELAAARMRLLTPEDLLTRMREHRAEFGHGPVDGDPRHRTLVDAIAWSYDALSATDQAVFRRIGVLRDFAPETATDVVDLPEHVVFGALDSLLSRSLILRHDAGGATRFVMLETLREYALRQLADSDETNATMDRLATHCLVRAEEAEFDLTSEAAHDTIERMSLDLENYRGALQHAIDSGTPDIGLRIAGSTWRFFLTTGRLVEGGRWLETLLSAPGASDGARAKGLTGLAGLAYWRGDYEEAATQYERALARYRDVEDRFGEADTLFSLSMTMSLAGDTELADALAESALSIFEELGSHEKIGQVRMAQAASKHVQGRHAEARPLWNAALHAARRTGDEQLAITELLGLAICDYHDDNAEGAIQIALEALDSATDLGSVQVTIWILDFLAGFAAHLHPEEAIRLGASVDSLQRSIGGGPGIERVGIEDARVVALRTMSPEAVEVASSAGRSMTLDQAVEFARGFASLDMRNAVTPAT